MSNCIEDATRFASDSYDMSQNLALDTNKENCYVYPKGERQSNCAPWTGRRCHRRTWYWTRDCTHSCTPRCICCHAELNETGQETEQLIAREGGRGFFIKTNISNANSIEQLHHQVAARYGSVSILVNNAETNCIKTLLDHSLEEWDRVQSVNLRGAFLCIKEFLPEMLQRKQGVIVMLESAVRTPYMSAYLASKTALGSLAMSLAQEVGEETGVSVFCFNSGMVDTLGTTMAFKELASQNHMTLDEFIHQNAKEGKLISAELSATGLIGTIIFARYCHGKSDIDYILGLSKLGLDSHDEAR